MKERPILLNTSMVQAVIDGRKTQTRRPVKKEHIEHIKYIAGSNDEDTEFNFLGLSYGKCQLDNGKAEGPQWLLYCTEYPEEGVIPIGQGPGAVGDRLWVRETWRQFNRPDECGCYEGCSCPSNGEFLYYADSGNNERKWKPSIHMPREACRLVLEITDVRIERVQEITEEDAKKEGCSGRSEFRDLWMSIYEHAWESLYSVRQDYDDWVWVIDFKIVELNGKKMEQAA